MRGVSSFRNSNKNTLPKTIPNYFQRDPKVNNVEYSQHDKDYDEYDYSRLVNNENDIDYSENYQIYDDESEDQNRIFQDSCRHTNGT